MRYRFACSIAVVVLLSSCVRDEPLMPPTAALRSGASDYTLRDLGVLAGTFSAGFDINDGGEVVGQSDVTAGGQHGFLWSASRGMRPLSTLGGTYSFPVEINEQGVSIGFAGIENNDVRSVLWDRSGQIRQFPVFAPGVPSLGVSINNGGDMTGCFAPDPNRFQYVPYVWTQRDGLHVLANLGGDVDGFGCGESINNAGDVVGRGPRDAFQSQGAFFWTARDGVHNIGSMAGGEPWAYDINDLDQVVGWEDRTAPDGHTRAFLWTLDNGFRELGLLAFATDASALGINNRGDVVGQSWNDAETHAFIWTAYGGMKDLGVPGQTSGAVSINDRGEIVGFVDVPGSGRHAALWIPTTH